MCDERDGGRRQQVPGLQPAGVPVRPVRRTPAVHVRHVGAAALHVRRAQRLPMSTTRPQAVPRMRRQVCR